MADFPNVVMVVLDTMRRDVLKIYGGSARTPCIEALASDGEVYRNCIAPSPWTVPSHATLFTGLTPSVHGVHETRDRKIFELYGAMAESGLETLAGYLRRRGYDTAGYSANPSVSPGTGFDAGFSHFQYFDMKEKSDQEASAALGRASSYGRSKWEIAKNLLKEGKLSELARLYSARRRVSAGYRKRGFPMVKRGDAIAAALSSRRLEEPFFTFVNFCEMHEPYVRPNEPSTVADIFGREKVDPPLLKKIRQAYVTEAEIVDGFVGSIVQHVKSLGAYERTLFVVTSDHGQALKEKGFYGHGSYMYDEILEVPLIVKYPKGKRQTPTNGYQPLARVPELVKDSLLGLEGSGSLDAGAAVAESFGSPESFSKYAGTEGFEAKSDAVDRPRKAVYSGSSKLVVDGKDGRVEEFTVAGRPGDPKENREEYSRLRAILAELKDQSFAIPG